MEFDLPQCELTTRRRDGALEVLDPLRRRYVALTPEEWVRQHFVAYLTGQLGYPAGLMVNEMGLRLNGTLRRCDTVVMDRAGNPLMIVEYKAPLIDITQKVFDQIVRYNMVLHAKYLVVSNGHTHYCCLMDYDAHSYTFLPEVPRYDDLI